MMNQTYKELVNIARAENVPYSKTNKRSLVDRIQQYRDTVGTLYREKSRELRRLARREGLRGYSQLKKGELIDSILYHRRVVKPRIDNLKTLTKEALRRQAKQVGLEVIGSRKDRIAHNLAHHLTKRSVMKNIVEDIAGEKFKAEEEEGSFNGNFRRFRSKGIEGEIVTIEEYLQKTRRHVLKIMKGLVKGGESWKINLKISAEFVKKDDPEDKLIRPIQGLSDTIMLGSDLEEVVDAMIRDFLQKYEKISQALDESDYVFHRIVEMYYHCHKVDLVRGSSYIELPDWLKNKKCCINPKNEDDEECFKWAVIAALHHTDIKKDVQRLSKLEP